MDIFYINKKSKKRYKLLGFVLMKDPVTRTWVDAAYYEGKRKDENNVVRTYKYVRESKDFFEKFTVEGDLE